MSALRQCNGIEPVDLSSKSKLIKKLLLKVHKLNSSEMFPALDYSLGRLNEVR